MSKIEALAILLCVGLIGLVSGIIGWKYSEQKHNAIAGDTIRITDTITIREPYAVDSVVVRKDIVYVPRVSVLTDTILKVCTDTITETDSVWVELPITQKVYADSLYKAWVSGYNPRLDSIRINRTIERITINKRTGRWGIGIQGGVGIGGGGLTPYVGIGVTYDIWKF